MNPVMIMLVNFSAHFSICLQHKMHRQLGGRSLALHLMLQRNRKSMEKKLMSILKLYASFNCMHRSDGQEVKIKLLKNLDIINV